MTLGGIIPKRDKNGMRNRRLSRPEDEIIRIDGGMPVIIEKDVWEAAKARMKDRKVPGRNYSKTVYPLSGLVKCGYCGANMQGQNCKTGLDDSYVYYICGRKHSHGKDACEMMRRSAPVLERRVWKYISTHYFDPDGLDAMIKSAEGQLDDGTEDHEANTLEKNLRSTEKKILNMTTAIERGMFQDSMVRRMAELEEDKARIERRLADISLRKTRQQLDRLRVRSIAEELSKIEMSPENRKLVFRALIDEVLVFNDHVKIKSLLG